MRKPSQHWTPPSLETNAGVNHRLEKHRRISSFWSPWECNHTWHRQFAIVIGGDQSWRSSELLSQGSTPLIILKSSTQLASQWPRVPLQHSFQRCSLWLSSLMTSSRRSTQRDTQPRAMITHTNAGSTHTTHQKYTYKQKGSEQKTNTLTSESVNVLIRGCISVRWKSDMSYQRSIPLT